MQAITLIPRLQLIKPALLPRLALTTVIVCSVAMSSGCAVSRLRGELQTSALGPIYNVRLKEDQSWESLRGAPTSAQRRLLDAAWRYAESDSGNLALIVAHGGKVVFERYHQDLAADGQPNSARHWHPARTSHVFSATKSVAGLLMGAAVKHGKLRLDDPVHRYLPELLQGRSGEDLEWARQMQVRHLLNLTSGLAAPPRRYFTDIGAPIDQHSEYDFPAYLLTPGRLEMENRPGERWNYFSGQLELFSAVLREAVKPQSVQAFAEEHLFAPIGFRYSHWNEDGAGNPFFFAGITTSARDFMRLALLLLNQGHVLPPGHSILPDDWLDQARETPAESPAYGLTLKLNERNPWNYFGMPNLGVLAPALAPWPTAPRDTVAMQGFKNNDAWIIESLDLAIVRMSDREVGSWDDSTFMRTLLGPDRGLADWSPGS